MSNHYLKMVLDDGFQGPHVEGEWYVLRDIDNRGDGGEPWETTSSTLSGFIGYVDGPLRSDVTSDEAREVVDEAIDALRRENFNLAEARLRELGVYLRLEAGEQG